MKGLAMRSTLFAVFLGLFALPAPAQGSCAMRDWIVAELADRYREQPVVQAVTERGELLEVLTSSDGATWTLLITQPTGMTCTLIEGQEWQTHPPTLALNQLIK